MTDARLFNSVAADYAAVRPGYPDASFAFVIDTAGITCNARLLEVGVGTGQATVGFVERGFSVLGLEPGPALAAQARRRFGSNPQVVLHESTFEQWKPEGQKFGMLFSAQAYHWVDPEIGTAKPLEVLDDRGWVALMWNIPVSRGDSTLRSAIHRAYQRHAPALAGPRSGGADSAATRVARRFAESGTYETAVQNRVAWARTCTAAEYVRLLGTFSDHLALPSASRIALLDEVFDLVDAAGGFEMTYDTCCSMYQRI